FALAMLAQLAPGNAMLTSRDLAVPHYDHILVIVEENRSYSTILDHRFAPTIAGLAATYGSAQRMYAERHPSEPNYVALVGGDTFGIVDDDAWYCVPNSTQPNCKKSNRPGYVGHSIEGPSLATQLRAKGLGWRAYLESIPAAGSLAIFSPETATQPAQLYASKHNGFVNFTSVRHDANLADEFVGFERLRADLRSGSVPPFTLVVPNQCNDMHGRKASPKTPPDCVDDSAGLVPRGDAVLRGLVAAIQASPIWRSGNTAIVVTWDENDDEGRVSGVQGCCVTDAHNPGGGRIPTLVITNHGPRGLRDWTPYDHYSLLRTIEDAFGLGHLRHAGDPGVRPMTPLFARPS
ncbi:MAG: phosphoesterase, partial [Candidatus Eremiobacteraeota bacterium]|nr:phosphoesterase [Candidatus Eremiobacteraeota bacterium]